MGDLSAELEAPGVVVVRTYSPLKAFLVVDPSVLAGLNLVGAVAAPKECMFPELAAAAGDPRVAKWTGVVDEKSQFSQALRRMSRCGAGKRAQRPRESRESRVMIGKRRVPPSEGRLDALWRNRRDGPRGIFASGSVVLVSSQTYRRPLVGIGLWYDLTKKTHGVRLVQLTGGQRNGPRRHDMDHMTAERWQTDVP